MKRYLSLIVLVALMLSFFGLGYAQVTTYPFVEDFETGQTHNTQVQGWTQILADGKTKYWTANSTFTNYNRTPRNGSFNAFLQYNSNAWMMRSFSFEGGVSYDVEIWARQDATSGATLAMYYGDTNTIAAMTNTIVAQVNLTNGDYQRYHGRITPATSGTYWIAIHGTATYAPWYISIDDFKVQHAPTTPVFSISPTGYDFGSLIINSTDSKTFTISNTGVGTLSISSITPSTDGYFSLANLPASFPVNLTAGQSATFDIQYDPTAAGSHTGSFTVSYTGGSTDVDVSGTCYDPTIYDFPWVEGFTNTTFPPADWARYTGLFPSDPLTTTTSGWTKTNFANVSNPANPSARLNIWSTTTKYWLVTPPIAIPATGYELNFDLALTKYNNSDPVDPTQQQDDRFIVLISDSANMASAAILREWNNTGSTNVYNSIATLGETITLDLSSHVGTKYIGFYGESTTDNGDNYLYVDQVRVRETPTAPIFSYAPDAINFYATNVGTATEYQNVTVTNIGVGTLTLNQGDVSIVGTDAAMFQVDPNLQSLALTADQSGNIPVRYNPTATGTHTATLRMSYGGTNYDVSLTGRAVGANALLESFEDTTFPPPAWNAGNWERTTFITPPHGEASASRNGSTSTQYVLSTPMLTIANDSRLNFWTRCSNSTAYLQVVYSTDRTTWTQLGSDLNYTEVNTWLNYDIDLSSLSGNNYYIGLRTGLTGGTYYVDMVVGPNITPLAPGAPGLVSPADAAIEVSVTPTFTWTVPSTGGIPTSYKIYCDANTTPTTLIGTSTELSFTPTTPLPYNTPLYWTVKAVNAVGDGPAATPRSFTTLPEGLVFIGDGTANNNLPIHPYYNFNYSQTIYLQSDINMPDKRVEQIAFYWNGVAAGTNSKGWTVYMAHTDKDSFTGTSDWVPYVNLTQVFSGDLNIPATAGWVNITLDTPFVYNNTDNLLIAVYENTPGNSGNSGYFYSTAVTDTRALLYRADSTNPNPIEPPAASYEKSAYANIKMQFGDVPPSPIFTYAPVTIDFGVGFVNTPMAYQDVTVTNTGLGTLSLPTANVSIIGTDAAMFELDDSNLPFTLTTGQSGTIPVRYNPTAVGTHTATLRMVHDGNNYDVALSGRSLSENALFESFEGDFPPVGWNAGNWSTSTISFHGTKSASKYGSSSTQYVLSTPMLTIDTDSRLNFWARSYNINGTLQVVYSTDRTNWVQLGSDITFAEGSTWYNQDIDLSTLAGNNYYLGFQTGLYATSYYVDYVIGPDIAAIVPDAPTLTAPADAATDVSPYPTLTWTAPATGGIPTHYNIYCDAGPNPTTLIGTSTTTSFTLETALTYNTAYYWTVKAENATGESVAATPRSFTTMADPTVYTIPFTEGFEDGQTHAAQVKNWVQHLDGGMSQYWVANSTNTDYGRTPRNGSFNATLRWNGNAWLMRPFSLQGGVAYDVEVWARQDGSTAGNADVGLYSGSGTIAGMTAIVEQTGIVNGDYQRIRGTFTPETTGIHWIGIHGVINSTPYYISIDDFSVKLAPTAPVFTYTPDAVDFSAILYDTSSVALNVVVTNDGIGTIHLEDSNISIIGPNAADFSVGTTNPVLPVDLGRDESVTIPVTVQSTTEGPISATLRIAYGGTNYDVALSAFVLAQNLDYVGTGTSYNGDIYNPTPYGGYYKNGREQYIVSAAELTGLGVMPGLIRAIGFNVHNPNTSANLPNFTISMGVAADTVFANTSFLTGLEEVYSKAYYTPTAGWNAHLLNSPFYWDGTSNIVIQTSYDMLGSAVRNASTYYTTKSAYQAMYYRSDYSLWQNSTTGTRSYDRPNMLLQVDAPIAGVPAAPILLAPTDAATNLPKEGFELKWKADLLNGGLPERYTVLLGTDPDLLGYAEYSWETTNTSFNPVVEDDTFSFAYGQRYYWTVAAENTAYGMGDVADPPFSFEIEADPRIIALPHVQNFDDVTTPNFPKAWTAYKSNSGSSIYTSSSYNQTPSNSVYMYTRTVGETMQLITPEVTVPINTIRVKFWLRASGTTNYSMRVGTVNATDGSGTFTQVAEVFPTASTTWEQHEVSFINYTGSDQYICFQAGTAATSRYYYLDSISFEEIHPVDLKAVSMVGPGLANVGQQLTYKLNVINYGLNSVPSYTVNLKDMDSNTLGTTTVNEALAPNATAEISVNWTPATTGTYSVFMEVVATGDAVADNDVVGTKPVTVYVATTEILSIGASTGLNSVNYIPFNSWYKSFVAETVYLASEIQASAGTIQSIVYYNDFNDARSIPAQIWMKNTTEVADMSTGWPTWNGYVQVFNGTLNCPAGKNEIVIPLTTPFPYTGGNLCIRTTKTMETDYSSNKLWIVTPDTKYPNRTRYDYTDSATGIDHTNPDTGTLTSNVPNITFVMDPATLVTTLDAPVVTVTPSGANAALAWEAIPYAYSYKVYASEDPYNFGTEPTATVYTNSATRPIAGKGFFKVTANTYRDYGRSQGQSMWESILNADITVENPIEKDMKEVPSRTFKR